MPCLNVECSEALGNFQGQNENDMCTICYTSELRSEACTQLSCGHIFHTNCIIQLLKHQWPTVRISFGFMKCPSCNQLIQPKGLPKAILEELAPLLSLKYRVEKAALKTAEEQGILARISDTNDVYYGKP